LLAKSHLDTDYDDPKAVKRMNGSTDRLRVLAENKLSVDDLVDLLNANNQASHWAAFHLLEFHSVTDRVKQAAVDRLELEVAKGGTTGIGTRMFLEQLDKQN